jgi:uncharacterized membrane protein YbhN (UPF0104 family)
MKLKQFVLPAKLIFSIGLIWFVSTHIDLAGSLDRIKSISIEWLIVIVILFYLQMAITAKRHYELLQLLGSKVSYLRCLDAMLICYFFSQAFISFVGGDAMRTLRIAQSGITMKSSAKAVILDRVSGLVGQIVILLLVLPFLLPFLPDDSMRVGMIGVVVAAMAAIVGVIFLARLPVAMLRFEIFNVIADLSQRVVRRIGSLRGFYAFFFLSSVINFMNCLIFYAISKGLAVEVSFIDLLVFLPPVFLLSMLPISVSGWGVREGAMVVALGLVGVSAADSLSISIFFGLALIAISLPGGAIWLVSHHKQVPNSAEHPSS